jgi:pyruvate/2-oxoglutarate dehydrogenase complex dihydrolipoamide dehydrogenase (E3) component
VDSHDTHYDEAVDRLLVAVGRMPNVEGLNLETAGMAYDKKGVQVNEQLQTTNRRVYAAGDICFPYSVKMAALK